MRSKPDHKHTERMLVGPSVWAYVEPGDASVLKLGAMFAFCFGVIGGFVTLALLPSKDGFISFTIGYGGCGIVGMVFGLILGASKQARSQKEEAQK